MKEILKKLALKGYEVRNKRILGNPLYTSEETKIIDKTQEIALIVEWLRVNYGIWVNVHCPIQIHPIWFFTIYKIGGKDEDITKGLFESHLPQEAYLAAFDYVLKELI